MAASDHLNDEERKEHVEKLKLFLEKNDIKISIKFIFRNFNKFSYINPSHRG